MSEAAPLDGPDLLKGVPLSDISDGGMLAGHAHGQPVLLVREGHEVFAISATCTHYGAPLAEGIVVDDTVRCPWHHACFNIRTGEAVRAPALKPVDAYKVERDGDRSEEHTSELQSQSNLVCRLLLEKKKRKKARIPVKH